MHVEGEEEVQVQPVVEAPAPPTKPAEVHKYRGQEVTIVRKAKPDDPGFNGAARNVQFVIKLADGTETVASSIEII